MYLRVKELEEDVAQMKLLEEMVDRVLTLREERVAALEEEIVTIRRSSQRMHELDLADLRKERSLREEEKLAFERKIAEIQTEQQAE